jgi:hypothetical protein
MRSGHCNNCEKSLENKIVVCKKVESRPIDGWLALRLRDCGKAMISLVRIVVALVSDAFRLVLLLSRPSAEIHAENLVLRKQLARYIERGVKPRRIDPATRISLALLTRMFDWHNAIVIVRPQTILRYLSGPLIIHPRISSSDGFACHG